MESPLRLMCVLAHPDDESIALGGTLARYAAEGIETFLVVATRGEVGWGGAPADYPGPLALGRIREAELRRAAAALGLREATFLDHFDGSLAGIDPAGPIAEIVAEVRRVRPDVVVTFGPDGAYGHPDHIAVSQWTTAAVLCAADPSYDPPGGAAPHRVAKLYHRIWTEHERAAFEAVFHDAGIDVDGERRRWFSWPEWAVAARLDTAEHWAAVREAVACHRSQVGGYRTLAELPPDGHRRLWGRQLFARAMSTVHVGHGVEEDLFAGLREGTAANERRVA
jgi:LmbE family N-acetylglucosaminyl deacetylase